MSDEAALLAAILAHPDEDTPRLMFADWLQEHGQPDRAEFIRLQCDPTAGEAAENRAAELEERNRVKWLAGLPQFVGARWEFRRGFPEHLEISAGFLLDRFEAFARVPWLRFLSIDGMWNEGVRDFCALTWPPQWVELELFEDIDTVDEHDGGVPSYDATPSAVALAECPQIDQLRRLRLSSFTFRLASDAALTVLRERLGERLVIG